MGEGNRQRTVRTGRSARQRELVLTWRKWWLAQGPVRCHVSTPAMVGAT
jgi:hypothetical protein